MNHVHLPGAVGITPFVLVKVCQYPCVGSTARHPSVPRLAIARAARCLPPGARPSVPQRSDQSAPVLCCRAPPVPGPASSTTALVPHACRVLSIPRPVRPAASVRLHGPRRLLCSSVPSEHGGDVDDCSSVTFLGLSVTFSVTSIEPQSLPQWTLYCDCKTHTGQGAAL